MADLFHRTPINHLVGAEFKCPGHRGRGARHAAVMRIDAVSSRREWEKRLAVRQNTTSCPTDQTGAWWEASQTAWGVKCTACVCVSIHEFRRSCCGVYICYHPRSDSGSVSPAIPSLVSYRVKGQLRLQAWWLMQKLQVDIRAKEVKNRLERMNVSA